MMSSAMYSFSACSFIHLVKKGNCFSLEIVFSNSLMCWLVSGVLLGWVWWVLHVCMWLSGLFSLIR